MMLETLDEAVHIIYVRTVIDPEPAPIDFREAMREYFSHEGNVRLRLTQEVA